MKESLNITTLAELQTVPYTDLLAAYAKADPAVNPSLVIDDPFLKADWRENFSFGGDIMIGDNGDEEAVVQIISGRYPHLTPPSPLSALTTTPPSSLLPRYTQYHRNPQRIRYFLDYREGRASRQTT
jgi:hypothetical protein